MKPLLCSCFDTSTEQSTIILNDFFCLNKDIDHYNFRSSSNVHKFEELQARTNYQKHSLTYIGVSIRNNLTKSIKEIKTCNLFRNWQLKLIFKLKQENLNFTKQTTGAPSVNFRKISVRKTIWDLEFSELCCKISCVPASPRILEHLKVVQVPIFQRIFTPKRSPRIFGSLFFWLKLR